METYSRSTSDLGIIVGNGSVPVLSFAGAGRFAKPDSCRTLTRPNEAKTHINRFLMVVVKMHRASV